MPGDRNLVDLGADPLQYFGGGVDARIDIGMRAVLAETFLDHANFQTGDALADGLGIGVDLQPALAGIVAVFARHDLQEKRVLRSRRRQRPGVIDGRVHAHYAGIGHKPPGRLDADDTGERGSNPDRAGLIAAGGHVDLARSDQRARAGR
jgi:hypothetical protein